MPVEMGDYDGDGKVDLVMGPMGAPSGPNKDRIDAGEVYILKGNQNISGEFNRADFEDGNFPGLTIYGARSYDMLGTELFTADINGDSFEDLIIGAQNYDGLTNDRRTCGGVFVIFGKEDLLTTGSIIDLRTLEENPDQGVLTIIGERPGDRLGLWVEAGDFDGDDIDDLMLTADQSTGKNTEDGNELVGMVSIIYGRNEWPLSIDLATARDDIEGISYIYGRDHADHFGACLHANDLDGDGRDELIIAAALNRLSAGQLDVPSDFPADGSGGGNGPEPDDVSPRFDAGEVYILFTQGTPDRLPLEIDFAQPLPPEIEDQLALVYGPNSGDAVGEELATGDFDGDQNIDLVLGGITARSPSNVDLAGAAFVLYQPSFLKGKILDLATLDDGGGVPGVDVSRFYGIKFRDILGDTISVGDFNNDNYDDLALGIPHRAFDGKEDAGEIAIIFGSQNQFPDPLFPNLEDLESEALIAFVRGPDSDDNFSYSMEARDYDGDGYDDLFPNSMRGDGKGNTLTDAGEVFLVSGFHLSGQSLEIHSVTPSLLPLGERQDVVIRGKGFTTTKDTQLIFEGAELTDPHVVSNTQINVTIEARNESGAFPIQVVNRYGDVTSDFDLSFADEIKFRRGDTDGNGALEITDPINSLSFQFLGNFTPPCLDASDFDDNGKVEITDPIANLSHQFLGTAPPAPPGKDSCGVDPTEDDPAVNGDLGCENPPQSCQ